MPVTLCPLEVQVDGHVPYVGKVLVATLSFVFFCKHLAHKKCSGIKGRLRSAADFKCRKCTGEVRPHEGRPVESVVIGNESL